MEGSMSNPYKAYLVEVVISQQRVILCSISPGNKMLHQTAPAEIRIKGNQWFFWPLRFGVTKPEGFGYLRFGGRLSISMVSNKVFYGFLPFTRGNGYRDLTVTKLCFCNTLA